MNFLVETQRSGMFGISSFPVYSIKRERLGSLLNL
jgi:hypothetical protein